MRKTDIDDAYGGGHTEAELPLLAAMRPAVPVGPFARSVMVPSDEERWLAELLWRHQGRENPISITQIRERWPGDSPMDDRQVKKLVEGLKANHRMPIGALRTSPGGYFIMRDIDDERAGMQSYVKQVLTSFRTWRRMLSEQYRLELAGQMRVELEGDEE